MVARFIVPALLLPALMAAAPFDAPAVAATTLSFDTAGDEGRFGFSGLVGIAGTEDVAATLTLTLLSRTSNFFLLGYSISNDTAGSFDRATLTGFGFDIGQGLLASFATGDFNRVSSGTAPGFGSTDLCLMAGGPAGSCNGNGNAGVRLGGDPGTGSLLLLLSAPSASLELSNSFARWSSVRSKKANITANDAVSAGFALPEPAPEPGTWALMIAGFGLIGTALRRRSGNLARINA